MKTAVEESFADNQAPGSLKPRLRKRKKKLTASERMLIHQVHPAKLWTDITTGIMGIVLFWTHHTVTGILVAVIPSVVVSLIVLETANLERLRYTTRGYYVYRYMSHIVEAGRLVGYVLMAVAAWYQNVLGLIFGLLIILCAWGWGLFRVAAGYNKNIRPTVKTFPRVDTTRADTRKL